MNAMRNEDDGARPGREPARRRSRQDANDPCVPPQAASGQTPALDDYRIGPDDLLAIIVWKNDALSRAVTVRPDGKISIRLLNDVQASGLTAMQLREELTRKLREGEAPKGGRGNGELRARPERHPPRAVTAVDRR